MGDISFLARNIVMYQLTSDEKQILSQAEEILTKVMERNSLYKTELQASESDIVGRYLQNKIGCEEREHFVVLFLDNQNCLIKAETLFSGSISSTSVYPREIIKRALELNAAAMIVGHNHPSGCLEPSFADRNITLQIKEAAKLMGIQLLDHFIVSPNKHLSFSSLGII